MSAIKLKRKAKSVRNEGAVHCADDGSSYVRGMSPTSREPLSTFFSASPVLSLKSVIQPKLTIGKPNDKYEREADRVADQVMRMPESQGSLVNGHLSLLQRKVGCPECMEEEEPVQTKTIPNQITPLVQRQEEPEEEEEEPVQAKQLSNKSLPLSHRLQNQIQVIRGGGQPLPQSTRSFFEPRFGRDFSNVRVHTCNSAAQINRKLDAQAFTNRNNIYFNHGKYNPDTLAGKRLLGHELTHVIQQGGTKFSTPVPQIQKYGRDVHEDMTRVEATGVGFTPAIANAIAREDQAVDTGNRHPWKRTPREFVNPRISGAEMLHFPSRAVALRELARYFRTCSIRDFGTALHRYQDTFSHSFPPGVVSPLRIATSFCWPVLGAPLAGKILLSHPLYGRWAVLKHSCLLFYPDDFMKNPEQRSRDLNMVAGTRSFLRRFLRCFPSLGTPGTPGTSRTP